MKSYSIDWFSFIIPTPGAITLALYPAMLQVLQLVEQHLGDWWSPVVGGGEWKAERGRLPYRWRIRNTETQVTLSWGNVNPHIYVEISGQACIHVNAMRPIEQLVEKEGMRASRVDFACDIETKIKPSDWISNMDGKRFKTRGIIESVNGETVYIGSRESERLARVYRYHEPHPRAKLLRVEVELKGEAARLAASEVARRGVKATCLEVNRPFRWNHPLWDQPDADAVPIPARTARRESANTVRWIYGSVTDALRRSILDGSLDLQEWLQSTGLSQYLQTVAPPHEVVRSSVEFVTPP